MDANTASRGWRWEEPELTGRARTHVVELAEPRCVLHREVVAPWRALRAAPAPDSGEIHPIT